MGFSHEVSRRRVALGTAWAVPAIVLASRTPAYAASDSQGVICPDVSWAAFMRGGIFTLDLYNDTAASWPVGLTITWTVQNTSATAALPMTLRPSTTYTATLDGSPYTFNQAISVPVGGAVTFTLTLTQVVDSGGAVAVLATFGPGSFASIIQLEAPDCGSVSQCVSYDGIYRTIGTDCPA